MEALLLFPDKKTTTMAGNRRSSGAIAGGIASTSLEIQPLPPGSPSYHQPYVSPAGMKISYDGEWVKQHHLDCDGLCLPFYQMLHKKVVGRDAYEEPACIPETVVFEHNFPQAWFSYEEENKELIKRPGKMLDAATMYEYFSAPCPGAGDVVAQFFHVSLPLESAWKSILTPSEVENGAYAGQYITYVEFFTSTTLSKFLFGQHRKPNGVLQRFVVPKGQGMSRKNMQIEVLWAPAITTARMRVNRHSLENRAIPLTDRLSTYEGAPHLSDELAVADETKNSLTCICQQIVEHFHRTEKKWLSRMLLYFKADDKNILWLLWCGGLRVESNALNPSFLRVPLMPYMRKEIISTEDATTTVDRLEKRRQQEKRLLALDYEFFHVTKDVYFAQNVNGTHRRQAKELRLRGLKNVKFEEGSNDPRRNVNHPLHESFIRVCDEGDANIGAPYRVGHGSSFSSTYKKGERKGRPHSAGEEGEDEAADDADELYRMQEENMLSPGEIKKWGRGKGKSTTSLPAGLLGGEVTEDMVRNELIALAMDAWYAMYSSTLSQYPALMPTSTMELSPPIAYGGVLTPQELATMTKILGIHSIHEDRMTREKNEEEERDKSHAAGGGTGRARNDSLGMSRLLPKMNEGEGATSAATMASHPRSSIYHPVMGRPPPGFPGGGQGRPGSSTSREGGGGEVPQRHTGGGEGASSPATDRYYQSSLVSHDLDIYKADSGVLSNARRLDRPSSQVEKELVTFFTDLFCRRGGEVVQACLKNFPSFFEVL